MCSFVPSICTHNSNTTFHIDYGVPLYAGKSDYRTCYKTYNDIIPNIPQDFDCRVKANFKPGLLVKDSSIRNDQHKTSYSENYNIKRSLHTPLDKCVNPSRLQRVDYARNIQEKIFSNPPPPCAPRLSETKQSNVMRFYIPSYREVYSPAVTNICEIKGVVRDEQPPCRPEQTGFWKLQDPYLTTSQSSYIPYNERQLKEAQDDLPTFYGLSGIYKGSSGVLLNGSSGNKTVFDKTIFHNVLPNRILPKSMKHVPHLGLQTEYNGKYLSQTFSPFYPYISDSSDFFEETLGIGGPLQNKCPPAMYCTEYNHLGSGVGVSAVVDTGENKEKVIHVTCKNNY